LLAVVFTLIFFLHGGAGIWQFLLGATPSSARGRVEEPGHRPGHSVRRA
jgi:hypothetical protein